MRRAVVVFVEDKRHLLQQLGCLYTSLKYIQSNDTDLVVFGTREALIKVPDDCIKVECELANNPTEFLQYRFINSISCLTGEQARFLDQYDLILRTDADVFLTPAWNTFYPDVYTVGQGGYVNDDETRRNIRRIASLYHLRHQGLHNVGSTHYGNAQLVREVCKLATFITGHILTFEFKDREGNWPGWYKGVASMYGCEIAVNHYVEQIKKDGEKLDYSSTSSNSIKNHPHIHCWHTDNLFSKFHFAAGNYDHLSKEDLNIDKVNEYCLYIALKSRQYFPTK